MEIYLGIIGVLIIIIVGWIISTSNRISRYQIAITESKSSVDIALAKRYDIISELCSAIKKFTEHENNIMMGLIAVRKGGTVEDTNSAIASQSAALKQIYAVGENYPDLKSSELYMSLMRQIAEQNEYLAAAKRTVNSNISIHNQLIVSFPASIVANSRGVSQIPFLQEENLEEKRNVSVKDML